MDSNKLIIKAIKEQVKLRTKMGAYGLVIIGIPELPLIELLDSYNDVDNTYISIVGSKSSTQLLLDWANANNWSKERLGFNSTHAVDVRNESPNEAIKLAFVWEEEDRLHSLIERGYQYIGPVEIIKQITNFGAEEAKNIPQKNLWNALGSESFSPYIALEGVTKYYLSLKNDNDLEYTGSIDSPRKNLNLLNLLPDKELLANKFIEESQIINRLIHNAKIVERIQRADEEDRLVILKTLKQNAENIEIKTKLQKDYNAYLRLTRSDYTALVDLELNSAMFLLSGKKLLNEKNDINPEEEIPSSSSQNNEDNEGDSLSEDSANENDDFIDDSSLEKFPDENKNSLEFSNLTEAAVNLAYKGEQLALKKLVDEALNLISIGKFDKSILTVNHEKLIIKTIFNPNEAAISINKNFTQNGYLGGSLILEENELETVLEKLGQYLDKAYYFDTVRTKTLLDLLKKAENLVEEFMGEELLELYIEKRAKLANYYELFSIEPLAILLADSGIRNKAIEYIDSYEALLKHLDEHYSKLHRESPEGAELIYKEILTLDSIKIASNNEISVILTSVNPLVLWKHVELADLILNKPNMLPSLDLNLIIREITNLPEPLLAIYYPEKNEKYEKLGFSKTIGSLPVYRSISIEVSDLSQKSMGSAALKLASLYPPVKENLRILLVDPVSTYSVSNTLDKLIEKYSFKKATLIVVKTGKQLNSNELPFDLKLKELVFEGKVNIEVLKVKNTEQLQKYLISKPVHLLGISGEKTRNVKVIEREGTRLHPLSVPHKLHVDPLIGTVTLKPRSIKAIDSGVKHPFNIYHKVVSEVTGNYDSEFSMQEVRKTPIKDINSLLPFTQFVITIGQVPEIIENNNLIRLTQNIEQSGDTVYTYHKESIINRLSSHLRRFNYQPTQNGLMTLLKRLQEVGGEGIFSTITEKGTNGFSESGVKGLLGLAVALNWYMHNSLNEKNIVVSLDSYLARRWLTKREDKRRSDFLGIRLLEDNSYSIDILEVKAYESTNESDVLDSHAANQLRSVAQIINNMVKQQGDLFTDRRRELLRLQIFRESLQLNSKHNTEWIKILNSIIDGDLPVKINLMLLEVAFDQNIEVTEQIFNPSLLESEEVLDLPIRRIRFGEKDIQRYLQNYVEKVPEVTVEDKIPIPVAKIILPSDANKKAFDDESQKNLEAPLEQNDFDRNSSEIILENNQKEVVKEFTDVNSEVEVLLGKQTDWEKLVYWDHRRKIDNPLSNHNIIITGDPGKGKTQTIKALMHELRENNIPILTFDFKDDYIDNDFLEKEKIKKFDVMIEGLPFNPLIPSIDPVEKKFTAISHIVQIEGILKRVYNLGVQQATQLRSALREAFERKGIHPNVPTGEKEVKDFPNFQDVFEILKEDEKKNATLIGRLDLLFQIGIFPNEPSINFDQLMEGSYTLRLSTLPDPDNEIKSAVAEIIILAVHNYLISKEHPRKLTRAIVLDEAHRVSNSRALLGLMREGRAFGIGMIIATQFPTDIPQDIYGCTETKLFLGNDDFGHAEAAAKKLEGSTSKQNVNMLADQIRNMKQFKAIVRNSQYQNVFIDLTPYYLRK